MKENSPQMEQLFHRSEDIDNISPKRSIYWTLHKTAEEGLEFEMTDPTIDRHEFLMEGADVIITWIKAMREAGVSWEVAYQAVLCKFDILEERFKHTNDLVGNGKTWDENYQTTK